MVMKALSTFRKVSRALAFPTLLLGLIWCTFRPSLGHMPRADHWCYLADTFDKHEFASVLLNSYSYNRTRQLGKGDVELFRPIFFAWLAMQKTLLENNFPLQQAFGLGLHFIVVLLFWRLMISLAKLSSTPPPADTAGTDSWFTLSRIKELLPHMLAIFFAINLSTTEMIIWAHIQGYMLFLVFVLAALHLLVAHCHAAGSATIRRRFTMVACWVLGLMSAFTYEIGQFLCVLLGLFYCVGPFRKGQWGRGLSTFAAFILILVFYQTINVLDWSLHEGEFTPENHRSEMLQTLLSPLTLEHWQRFTLYTIFQPFFPFLSQYSFSGSRLNIAEIDWEHVDRGGAILSVFLFSVFLFLLLNGLRLLVIRKERAQLGVLFVVFGIWLLYSWINILGRMNLRPGPLCLSTNSYYAYPAFLLFLIIAFLALNALPLKAAGTWTVSARCLALMPIALGELVWMSGFRINEVCWHINKECKPSRSFMNHLRDFVKRHENEPGFCLAIDVWPPAMAALQDNLARSGCNFGVPGAVILAHRWTNNQNPKFLVHWEYRKLIVRSAPEGASSGYSIPFPDLRRIGEFYNIYYHGGFFYGILHADGAFDPDRDDYPYLIKDRTLEGLYAKESSSLSARQRAILAGDYLPRGDPVWFVTRYLNFNIFKVGEFLFALPTAEGVLSAAKYNAREYPLVFHGKTLIELKKDVLRVRLAPYALFWNRLLASDAYRRATGYVYASVVAMREFLDHFLTQEGGPDEGHYSRRRPRYPVVPDHAGSEQATSTGLQQAHGVLPAVGLDAGRGA
jgi:hypothetical protein